MLRNAECASLLIEAGANTADPSVMRLAVRHASVDVLQLLVTAGVDFRQASLRDVVRPPSVFDVDPDLGSPALILYDMPKLHDVSMELLLLAGADATAIDCDGHSLLFNLLDVADVFDINRSTVNTAQVLLAASPLVPDVDAVLDAFRRLVEASARNAQSMSAFSVRVANGTGVTRIIDRAEFENVHVHQLAQALLAADWTVPSFVADVESVAKHRHAIHCIRCRLVRPRLLQICIALQALELPAFVTLAVVDAALPLAPMLPMHVKWRMITAVKHAQLQ